jgi:hypothetical protein
MHLTAGLADMLAQPIQIPAVIITGKEEALMVVAALDELKRDIQQCETKCGEWGDSYQSLF